MNRIQERKEEWKPIYDENLMYNSKGIDLGNYSWN